MMPIGLSQENVALGLFCVFWLLYLAAVLHRLYFMFMVALVTLDKIVY